MDRISDRNINLCLMHLLVPESRHHPKTKQLDQEKSVIFQYLFLDEPRFGQKRSELDYYIQEQRQFLGYRL